MTIDRWASMTASSSVTRPQVAPGTACAPCKAKGHDCPAFEIVDGQAVCIHCLDGVPCMRAPRQAAARDNHLPDAKQAKKAIAAHESLAAATPQAALAPAQPTATGMCSRGCGRLTHRGQCKRASVDDAAKVRAKRAVESTVKVNLEAMLKEPGVKLEKTIAETCGLSAKSIAEGYKLVSLQDVPGRKPASVYEGIVADLVALPVNSVLTRTYASKQIAHAFMCGITRLVRQKKLKVSQVQEGATIYVWLRA